MNEKTKKIWLAIAIILALTLMIAFLGGAGPRWIALLVFLALVPAAVLMPREYLVAVVIVAIPLAPHTRLFSEQLPSMTLDYPLVALCGVVLLYPAIKLWRRAQGIWVLVGCWAAFILLAFTSWMFQGGSPVDLFTVNRFGYFAAVLVMGAALVSGYFNFKKLCRVFYAVAFIVAFLGLVQFFFYNHLNLISDWFINAFLRPGMDYYYYYYRIADRVISTFGNPHTAGMFLCVALLMALGSNFWGFNKSWTRILWVLVLVTAIVLTRSRTTYICLASCYVLAILLSHRKNLLRYAGGLGFLALSAGLLVHFLRPKWIENLMNYQGSLQARFDIWAVALDRFASSPLLGAGPNPNIRVAGSELSTVPVDNLYLTVMASYGLIGLALLLFVLYWIFRMLFTASRGSFNGARVARGLGLGLVAILIANLSGDFLFHTRIFGSYLLLLGCYLASGLVTGRGEQEKAGFGGVPKSVPVDGSKQKKTLKVMLAGNAASVHLRRWGSALAQKGLEVHIFSPDYHPVEGCVVHRVGRQNITAASAPGIVDALRRLFMVEKGLGHIEPHLIHIHGAFSFGWYFTTFSGGPVVASVWGGDIYRYAVSSWRKRLVVRSILNRADLITVPSEEVAADVRGKFGFANTLVLPWGVDDRVFYPRSEKEKETIREWLNIPSEAELVLSPRTLSPLYNVDALVEAIPKVLAARDNVYFCFLQGGGDAGYRDQLKKRAFELGVYGNTRWVDEFLSSEQMARLFSTAGIFVSVPDTDNLGSTVLEGMACGSVPVVKNLPNYRPLHRAGALMHAVNEVRPDSLAAAVLAAMESRSETATRHNVTAALSLGTWREAVERMVYVYYSLVSGRIPGGEKH